MIKILGLADMIAGLIFGLKIFHFETPVAMTTFFALYLILKGLAFVRDIASLFDIFSGVLLLTSLVLDLPSFLLVLCSLFLLMKGVLSLL